MRARARENVIARAIDELAGMAAGPQTAQQLLGGRLALDRLGDRPQLLRGWPVRRCRRR